MFLSHLTPAQSKRRPFNYPNQTIKEPLRRYCHFSCVSHVSIAFTLEQKWTYVSKTLQHWCMTYRLKPTVTLTPLNVFPTVLDSPAGHTILSNSLLLWWPAGGQQITATCLCSLRFPATCQVNRCLRRLADFTRKTQTKPESRTFQQELRLKVDHN